MNHKKNKKSRKMSRGWRGVFITVSILVVSLLGGVMGYQLAHQKYRPDKVPNQNTPGYITADAAREQVENFYRQYLNPRKDKAEESRQAFVRGYGSKNLEFYREYYQHGFDPIVCSAAMPTDVVVTSVRPGMGAEVVAQAQYPDGSRADIVLTLVINAEGFKIDSITCSGNRGDLPPRS